MEIMTNSSQDTTDLGRRFAGLLMPGDVLAISGELGAGKTTFIQGIAKGFGVKEFVSSPSFIIINEYKGSIPIYHVDLYRLEDVPEIESLGIEEYFERGGVAAVEWAEKLGPLLPEKHISVAIEPVDENRRKITITDRSGGRDFAELGRG